MNACEHCWSMSGYPFDDYATVLRRADEEGAECTKDTIEGARLRAGQWWDDVANRDTRRMTHTTTPGAAGTGEP